MKIWINILAMSGMAVLLSGCFDGGIPSCDSDEAKKVVKNIIGKKIDFNDAMAGVNHPLQYVIYLTVAGDNLEVLQNGSRDELKSLVEKKMEKLELANIITESTNKDSKVSFCSADITADGKVVSLKKRLKYKLSMTTEGKLYVQAGFQ